MLAIQEYISLFDNIETANRYLTKKLHIRIKEEELLIPIDEAEESADEVSIGIGVPEIVYLYNYHPTKSPRNNSIVEEANGLILNQKAEIVSMSFRRIYSLNESCAPEIDWNSTVAEMHEDGTLVVIFRYKGRWFIQTKRDVHAVESMKTYNISIRVAALAILGVMFEEKRGPFYPLENCGNFDLCYAFEFVSPYNRNITSYPNNNLILLGVFDKKKLTEKSEKWINSFQKHCCNGRMFVRPRAYGIDNSKDASELTKYMRIREKGLIIKDCEGNRIKIKNPNYLALSKLINSKGETSPETYAKIALSGYATEVKQSYPEYTFMLDMFTSSIISIKESATHAWEEYYGKYAHRDDCHREAFFRRIEHLPKMFRTILFRMRQKKIKDIEDGVREMRPKTLVLAAKSGYGDLFDEEVERLKRVIKTGGSN